MTKKPVRAFIYLGMLAFIILLLLSSGYFLLPVLIEREASARIEKAVGFPARVELSVPFDFIISGKVNFARIYLPLVQINGLNIRDFDLQTEPFRIPFFKLLSRDYSFLKDVKGQGSFVITPKDLNDYLKESKSEYRVEIKENTLYLQTYAKGIGKMVLSGRLEPHSSGASFVAERIVEPKMLTLIVYPQIWANISFSFDFSPADRVLELEKYFVDERFIRVFFKLKKDFYEEAFN